MKKFLAILLVIAVLASLTACSATEKPAEGSTQQASGEKVTISFYSYMNEDDKSQVIPKKWAIEQMKTRMPNVEVEIIPWYSQSDQIKVWAASNELPDIVECNQSSTIAELLAAEKLMPIETYLQEYNWEHEIKESYYQNLINDDGHIYQIPTMGADTCLLYYNKTLFDQYGLEPPTDIDKVFAAIDVFSQNGILPIGLWGDEIWPVMSLYDGLLTKYNPDGIKVFDGYVDLKAEDYYLKCAQTMYDMQQRGAFTNDLFTTNYNAALAKFAAGETAMFQNGTWALSEVYEALGENAGVVSCPWGDAATMEKKKGRMSGGTNLTVYICAAANTEHPDIVGEWMAQYALLCLEGNILKSSKLEAVLTKEVTPETPYTSLQKAYADILSDAETFTYFTWDMKDLTMVDALTVQLQNLMSNVCTPEQFIDNLQKSIDREFK